MTFNCFLDRPSINSKIQCRKEFKKVSISELEKLKEKLKRKRFKDKRVLKSEMAVSYVKWSLVDKETINEIEEAILIVRSSYTFDKVINGEYEFFSQGIYYFKGVRIEIDFEEIVKQLRLEKIKELENEKDQIRGGLSYKSRGITNENKQSIITQKYLLDEVPPYDMEYMKEKDDEFFYICKATKTRKSKGENKYDKDIEEDID